MNVVDLAGGQPVGTDHLTAASAADHLLRRAVRGSTQVAPGATPEVLFVQDRSLFSSENDSALEPFLAAPHDIQVVLGMPQRDLFSSPGSALQVRDRVRARGWALAVNNVGVDPASLAMLPLIEPEVVGLDASVIHRTRPDAEEIAAIAVGWARRWGALVIAEGVRTAEHREFALGLGAQLGHGPLWSGRLRGQVRARVETLTPWVSMLSDWAIGTGGPTSPAQLLDRHPDARTGDLAEVLAHSHRLETRAVERAGRSSVLLAAFQHRRRLGRESKDRFVRLARTITFVGVLGVDMPDEPLPGVRGANVEADEAAAREWNVVTLSPGYEAALISREVARTSDGARRFEYLVTDDRATVRHAARIMLRRFGSDVPSP